MNLNDDIVYRCRRLGPLRQRHPGRSRSLIRHHDSFHLDTPCFSSPQHATLGLQLSAAPHLDVLPHVSASARPARRTWQTSYRGPLLIHGGKRVDWDASRSRLDRRRSHSVPNDIPSGDAPGQDLHTFALHDPVMGRAVAVTMVP